MRLKPAPPVRHQPCCTSLQECPIYSSCHNSSWALHYPLADKDPEHFKGENWGRWKDKKAIFSSDRSVTAQEWDVCDFPSNMWYKAQFKKKKKSLPTFWCLVTSYVGFVCCNRCVGWFSSWICSNCVIYFTVGCSWRSLCQWPFHWIRRVL